MAGKVVDGQAYKGEVTTTLGNHMDAVGGEALRTIHRSVQ